MAGAVSLLVLLKEAQRRGLVAKPSRSPFREGVTDDSTPSAASEPSTSGKVGTATPNFSEALALPAPEIWIDRYVTIEDPQDDGTSAIIPFRLWDAQRELLTSIRSGKKIIILKARQLGITWLILAFAMWYCLHFSNRKVIVLSKDLEAAQESIKRVQGMFDRLPDNQKPARKGSPYNTTTATWSNGSSIRAFSSSRHAATSFTGSLLIFDEFAKVEHAEDIWASAGPTINDGAAKCVIVSTSQGEDNLFASLWEGAVEKTNSFIPLFIPWYARPTRTSEWYELVERDAPSPAHHKREYPSSPEEAFISVGTQRYLPDIIFWDNCYDEGVSAARRNEPIILAMDAGISDDSFAIVGVGLEMGPTVKLVPRVVFVENYEAEGARVDFDNIANFIDALARQWAIVKIVYDPYQLQAFAQGLAKKGFKVEEFSQGPRRAEADKLLRDLIYDKLIVHDSSFPGLREALDNANLSVAKHYEEDANIRMVKRSSRKKIDAAVALSMAAHSAWTHWKPVQQSSAHVGAARPAPSIPNQRAR